MRLRIFYASLLLLSLLTASAPIAFAAHIHQSSWASPAYYPGDQASFHMTLFNDYPGTIFVKEVRMQWDWQSDGSYFAAPGGQTLIPIQTADYAINFTVPPNVSVGEHVWTIYYVDAKGTQIFVGQGALTIHDQEERVYLDLRARVQTNLTKVISAPFENPNATALAFLANEVYNNATSLAEQGDFVSATPMLRNSSTLASNAIDAEAKFQSLKKTYLSDLSLASVAIGKGESSNFQSENATRYLNQAVAVYERATYLASGLKYGTADILLKNVSSLIDQANLAERMYLGERQTTSTSSRTATSASTVIQSSPTSTAPQVQQAGFFPVTLAIGGLAGFVLLSSIVILLLRRRG